MLEYLCSFYDGVTMKYDMFIGEMLADRTRRATLKELQGNTPLDLLSTLREAMGEPTPNLSKRYVLLRGGQGSNILLHDVALAFEHQRVENPSVRRFEEKGFQVDCVLKGENLIFIEAWAPIVERDVFVCNKAMKPKNVQIWARHRDAGPYSSDEFMQAVWSTFFVEAGDFGVSWSGRTTEPEHIRIGFQAYLRSMWTLLWTAFRYPFTTTVIDLSTGKRLAELSIPFHQWEASLTNRHEEPVNG
jgi:hypothetical protein